ncbi:MAG: FAD-dependent oxidoreductase [Rhodocyclaceae bacterium]|nr:FAD-dependent oxidoreductase [Rhodocyclaceae bacterium]
MKRLILAGGGHAHLAVLAELARLRPADVEVVLLSPYARQIYSGMLPGWMAGHYTLDQIAIPLPPLAAAAGAKFVETAVSGLDVGQRGVLTRDGASFEYDLLSLDIGPAAPPALAAPNCLSVRPIEGLVEAWPQWLDAARAAPERNFRIAVAGAGAGGLELAFAMAARAAAEGLVQVHVSLVGTDPEPVPGLPRRLRRKALRLLDRRDITWIGGRQVEQAGECGLALAGGTLLAAERMLMATGAAAPDWPAAAGLAVDAGGFVRVGPDLQSLSHPGIFAAGDIAALPDPRPKSGVYAVRAGPPLAANIIAALNGSPTRPWVPQTRALYLISTGRRHALAAWGGLAWSGAWVWRWKDRIDRSFVARYHL